MAGLKDIALASGYSIRTVNRAIKNKGYVSAAARRKILEVVAERGYRPNRAARSLRTQRSFEIVVCAWSTDELHMAKIAGLENVLRDRDYSVAMILDSGRSRRIHSQDMLDTVADRRPAGVVVFPFGGKVTRKWVGRLQAEEIPAVVLDVRTMPQTDGVEIDRQQGVYEAVHYLAEKGYRRIGYVGSIGSDTSRLDGYHRALTELGQQPRYIEPPGGGMEKQFEQGREAAGIFAGMEDRPDAVQVYSDVMALGYMAGCHDRGIRVPDDVAVVGFDDRHAASLSWPALTTVAQPNHEVGKAAAGMLLEMIEHTRAGGVMRCSIPTRLVVRESA